jgi:hypothetical protein
LTYHLTSSHAARLDRELATAHVKQVLERRAEEVNDKDVVETFLAKVVDLGDASWNTSVRAQDVAPHRLTASAQNLVAPVLVAELRCIRLARLLDQCQRCSFLPSRAARRRTGRGPRPFRAFRFEKTYKLDSDSLRVEKIGTCKRVLARLHRRTA